MDIPYTVHARPDTGLYNAKVGIWLFLASEVMLFGGLFSSYIFLRVGADYPWPVHELNVTLGCVNTVVLIASSVSVVWAWAALKMRKFGLYKMLMLFTVACAARRSSHSKPRAPRPWRGCRARRRCSRRRRIRTTR